MSEETYINLEEISNIDVAQELHDKLKEAALSKNHIKIDGSAIEKIDTACIQVLLKFISDSKDNSTSWEWVNPSESFIQTAETLGLKKMLNFE